MHESPNLVGTRTLNQKEVFGHPVKPPKIDILQRFVFQMVSLALKVKTPPASLLGRLTSISDFQTFEYAI